MPVFTIAEVRELLAGGADPPAAWRDLAQRKLAEVDAVIEKAHVTRRLLEKSLGCNCVALEDCTTTVTEGCEPSPGRRPTDQDNPQSR